jgi:Tfp pilus assembly protein PilX
MRRPLRMNKAAEIIVLRVGRIAETASRGDGMASRRGAVMVFALMALLVASLMIGSLLKTAGMSHRQLKKDEHRLQASFLADAGCERARMLLQTQPDFSSGEWSIPPEQLAPDRSAKVLMTVSTDLNQPDQRIVTAVAQYPLGHPDLVRITRQIRIR